MKIEIIGTDAISATEELLDAEELEGTYETVKEVEREAVILTTIASIVTIIAGAVAIYDWYQKNCKANRIEKAIIILPDGRRLLLKNATVEQIKSFLGE
jgi:hypothetical protein